MYAETLRHIYLGEDHVVMADKDSLVLPDEGKKFRPMMTLPELDAAMKKFEATHPNADWQSADDTVIMQYTDFAQHVAWHLLHAPEIAKLIYKEHTSLFVCMGDSVILCVTACRYFGYAVGEQEKRESMKNLDAWHDYPNFQAGDWLASSWRRIYSSEKAKELVELWEELLDLYRFYLSWPEWG